MLRDRRLTFGAQSQVHLLISIREQWLADGDSIRFCSLRFDSCFVQVLSLCLVTTWQWRQRVRQSQRRRIRSSIDVWFDLISIFVFDLLFFFVKISRYLLFETNQHRERSARSGRRQSVGARAARRVPRLARLRHSVDAAQRLGLGTCVKRFELKMCLFRSIVVNCMSNLNILHCATLELTNSPIRELTNSPTRCVCRCAMAVGRAPRCRRRPRCRARVRCSSHCPHRRRRRRARQRRLQRHRCAR